MGSVAVVDVQTGEVTTRSTTAEEDTANQNATTVNAPIKARVAADREADEAAKADSTVQFLVSHTPQECYDYVQNNVTNLAQAKEVMGRLALAMSAIARRYLR